MAEREPLLHTHVEDGLPEDHPQARTSLYCRACATMVHAHNNECMTDWVETGDGPYCVECFAHGRCPWERTGLPA